MDSKKTMIYPITVEPCKEGGFFVKCTTLQGCHAEGQTYGEAIDNIADVIKAHLELRQEHNEFIPVALPSYG